MAIELDLDLFFGKLDGIEKQLKNGARRPLGTYKRIGAASVSSAFGLGDNALAVVPESPKPGRVWFVHAIHLLVNSPGISAQDWGLPESPAGAFQTGQYGNNVASVSGAAAAQATLTFNLPYISSWRVDPAAAWPAGTNQVTITNLPGGTQTYDLPGGTTNSLIVSYPQPLPIPFGHPVITVPAIVGGPAYTISATGVSLGNNVIDTAADFYIGIPPIDANPNPVGGLYTSLEGLIDSNLGPMPIHKFYPDWSVWVHAGQQVFTLFNAVPGGGTLCVFMADVSEFRVEDVELMSS